MEYKNRKETPKAYKWDLTAYYKDDRLKRFHENSYKIAEEYKEAVIEEKWMNLLENII